MNEVTATVFKIFLGLGGISVISAFLLLALDDGTGKTISKITIFIILLIIAVGFITVPVGIYLGVNL